MTYSTPNLHRTRTLIVEEDSRIRKVLNHTLTKWNAAVSVAESSARGVVALKHARDRRKPFELVLVAAEMSGMDGFEFCKMLQSHPDELASTILMLEPNPHGSHMQRATELGVTRCLTKPLSGTELHSAVSQVVWTELLDEEGTAETRNAGPIRVLVVDDSPDTRELIHHFLDDPEFRIDLAENGEVAVGLFRLREYDLVLMDIQMPVSDGYEATQAIRAWETEQTRERIPVVAFTGYTQTGDRQKSLRSGFDAYLEKPVKKQTLIEIIRRFVKRGHDDEAPTETH